MSTLGSLHIVSLTAVLPAMGAIRADVELQNGPLPVGKQTLTIATSVGTPLSWSVSVLRADYDDAGRPHAIVVGGVGWQNLITSPIGFESAAGVRLGTVLGALSRGSGEQLEAPTGNDDRQLGDHYSIASARPGEPSRYGEALTELVRIGALKTWHVDPDGITRFNPPTPVEIIGATRANLVRNDSSVGIATYSIDNPALFRPGNTINGVTNGKVIIREISGKLEADVFTTASGKKSRTIREMLQQIVPQAALNLLRTYTVVAVNGDGTLNLVPSDGNDNLPEIPNCEQWTLGGAKFKPSPGQQVTVLHRDRNGARPIAFAFQLDSGDFLPAARQGDTVRILWPPMVFNGTIGGTPATGVMVSPVGTTLGTIETGSGKVDIES